MSRLTINIIISATLIVVMAICAFVGGPLGIVFGIMSTPGFIIIVQIKGGGGAMDFFSGQPIYIFLINFFFYFIIIALIQWCIAFFRELMQKR